MNPLIASFISLITLCITATAQPSVRWLPPETFDTNKAGLGLPLLPGTEHQIIYHPIQATPTPSAPLPLQAGMYNHHPEIIVFRDKIIVTWTNHLQDENGPGQRMIAKVGTLNEDRTSVNWGGNETLITLAESPIPMARRHEKHNATMIDGAYARGGLFVSSNKLFYGGKILAYDGWTNDIAYHGRCSIPVPTAKYSDGRNRKTGMRFDIQRDLGLHYYQSWTIEGSTIAPNSPIYTTKPLASKIEVSTGRFKTVPPLAGSYQNPKSISDSNLNPTQLRHAIRTKRRIPNYRSGTSHLTKDGSSGLAHQTEFQRPDGSWVVIRDNLIKHGQYYAASVSDKQTPYPPAIRTNLFGDASPIAGELPDGRVWILGNDRERQHFYITVSNDGYTFDRTWLVYQAAIHTYPGLGKSKTLSGPQYPHAVIVGDNLWITYSIGKEMIGITQIPIASLQ
ncbi:hypothetical protein [Poriferisphaera sp. WC338]|uniref:hypothetical protein n=1 Tax=Poriferisphaera sp. WC338 TaxID=3425129 RepID=UPI003D8158D1